MMEKEAKRYEYVAHRMRQRLFERIYLRAYSGAYLEGESPKRDKWKKTFYAMCWGASLKRVLTGRTTG